MLLSETIEGLYNTELYAFNNDTWELMPQVCSLQTYDRFVSDRAFGQKKRILLVPGNTPLQFLDRYYRVGSPGSDSTFIIESQNPDINEHGTYLHVYMMREVQSELRVEGWVVTGTNAAGVDRRERQVLPGQHWCDLERYGVLNSTETMVAYSSYTLTTSRSVPLPADARLIVDLGYREVQFRISERFDLMNSIQLRVGEWDGQG